MALSPIRRTLPLPPPPLPPLHRSLALESTLLPSQLHTALDDVATLESSMSAVTTLLGAFANIVEEQSEVVGEINRQAITAKTEVEKGGGELRTAKKHIEATSYVVPVIIVVMGWTLLFVNWYTP
jgi:t-SNARE complex subunit (syntaxin)